MKKMSLAIAVLLLSVFAVPASASPAPEGSAEDALSAVLQPPPLAAASCLVCIGFYTTSTTYATGNSCATAQSNLQSLLQSLARSQCSPLLSCNLAVHYTVACQQISPGVYRVDGNAQHGCKENVCA